MEDFLGNKQESIKVAESMAKALIDMVKNGTKDLVWGPDMEFKAKKKSALITGVCGQDGSYLADLLLEKGYKVYGLYRRTTAPNFQNIAHIINHPDLELIQGDITDTAYIFSCLSKIKPDELYNLAAMSFVKASFETPINTFDVDATAVTNMLEAIKQVSPHTRMYQASTSEMFGKSMGTLYSSPTEQDPKRHMYSQDEKTPFAPQSPYAVAKLAAHHMCRIYREAYGVYVCSNILFNHESPRRGKEFVTRKITDYIGRLIANCGSPIFENGQLAVFDHVHYHIDKTIPFPQLSLGNIYSSRDWGFSKDYMEAAWLTLQKDKPDDYVICTGKTHTVEDLLSFAFNHVGLDWKEFVVTDKEYFRPSEVEYLCGNSDKARKELGWSPKVGFEQLVTEMVDSSIKEHKNG